LPAQRTGRRASLAGGEKSVKRCVFMQSSVVPKSAGRRMGTVTGDSADERRQKTATAGNPRPGQSKSGLTARCPKTGDGLPDARQVSWLADHRPGAPSRFRLEPVALCAGTTAYSCGDSSGIEQRALTGFPSPDLAGDPKILCSWGAVTTICCDMTGRASSCF